MRKSERMIKPSILGLLAGIFLLFGATAQAAVINVTTDVDGDPGSLRAAVNTANTNGDASNTINVPSGNYILTTNTQLLVSAGGGALPLKDLTISGAGSALTTIRGSGGDRVFSLSENAIVYIVNLSILNGNLSITAVVFITTVLVTSLIPPLVPMPPAATVVVSTTM